MNPKLIIASIAGISTLGGGVAGGYYYFNSEKTIENTNSESKTTESLESTSPKQENAVQSEPNLGTTSPQTKGPEQISPDSQNDLTRVAATSSTGTGGVAETGVVAPRSESGSRPSTTADTLNSSGMQTSRT